MLEMYANIAEIVGVVLVIVTLVFLTLEIRHNTQALRSTTIQAVMQSEMAFSSILTVNHETWDKVLSGEPLESGAETRKAIVLYNVFMIDTESRYQQFLLGYLDEQSWEGRRGTLPEIVRLPIFPLWRESFGGQSHSESFLALLDDFARESNSSDEVKSETG
jgi:hypothetical protein